MSPSRSGYAPSSATSTVSTSSGLVARAWAVSGIGALAPVVQRVGIARRREAAAHGPARARAAHFVDAVVVAALLEQHEIADGGPQPNAPPLSEPLVRARAAEAVVELADQRVAETQVVNLELAAGLGQGERDQRADLAGGIDDLGELAEGRKRMCLVAAMEEDRSARIDHAHGGRRIGARADARNAYRPSAAESAEDFAQALLVTRSVGERGRQRRAHLAGGGEVFVELSVSHAQHASVRAAA